MNKSQDKLFALTPHVPFTLLDMIRFLPNEFHTQKFIIEQIALSLSDSNYTAVTEAELKTTLGSLTILKIHCRTCGLDKTIKVIEGIDFALDFQDNYSPQKLGGLLEGMLQIMREEFKEQSFAFLPKATAHYFERDDLFGKHFHALAPDDINAEIRAAGNCLAAELNTAAAFHTLRACERGARRLARKLRVVVYRKNKRIAIDDATWNELVDKLDEKLERDKKPHERRLKKHYREYELLIGQLDRLKDDRNDIMHTRRLEHLQSNQHLRTSARFSAKAGKKNFHEVTSAFNKDAAGVLAPAASQPKAIDLKVAYLAIHAKFMSWP